MEAPVLQLSVRPQETRLTCGGQLLAVWSLGTATLWPLRAAAPSAVAIETAIQRVEDLIDALAAPGLPRAVLVVDADSMAPLQRGGAIAVDAQGTIERAQIEREYQALAARAVGAPSALGSAFDDPAGDALVLILRELMQHLGFERLVVRD